MKWEYKHISTDEFSKLSREDNRKAFLNLLNRLGQHGWEVAFGLIPYGSAGTCYEAFLKRSLPEE